MNTLPLYPAFPIDTSPDSGEQPWREWQAHVDAGRIATTRLAPEHIVAARAMEALFRANGLCRR
ncbi:hypothetical protein [Sphingomonas sp.]|uniref:hypothetical protein n=1 Tax=Sphingomonas sp. TaxID=28214 RepID=UPI0035C7A8F8